MQIPLDYSSKELLVINTPKGLFCYTWMPYGISSSPGIFQRFMENVLQGLSHVVACIIDILITGGSEEPFEDFSTGAGTTGQCWDPVTQVKM